MTKCIQCEAPLAVVEWDASGDTHSEPPAGWPNHAEDCDYSGPAVVDEFGVVL